MQFWKSKRLQPSRFRHSTQANRGLHLSFHILCSRNQYVYSGAVFLAYSSTTGSFLLALSAHYNFLRAEKDIFFTAPQETLGALPADCAHPAARAKRGLSTDTTRPICSERLCWVPTGRTPTLHLSPSFRKAFRALECAQHIR